MAANILDIPLPTQASSDAEWLAWYDLMPFSKKDNNYLFIEAWNTRGSDKANTRTLRTTMGGYGVHIAPDGILASVGDTIGGVWDGIGSALKVGGTVVLCMWVAGGLFTAALIWRIVTPENVEKGLDVAAKGAVV